MKKANLKYYLKLQMNCNMIKPTNKILIWEYALKQDFLVKELNFVSHILRKSMIEIEQEHVRKIFVKLVAI